MKYQIGEWIADSSANQLTSKGESVRIEPRVMAVLVKLVEAKGEVVTKDALIETVWNGVNVSDHSVANTISELRRILGDDRRKPRYIETIQKSGYRLIAAAAPAEPSAAVGAARLTSRHAAILVAIGVLALALLSGVLWSLRPAASAPMLYLTDFQSDSSDPRITLSGETAEEMLSVLLTGGRYRLVRWRQADAPPENVLRAEDRILQGRILIDGGEPLLSLQLIDARDGASLWAGAYALQSSKFRGLSETIAGELQAYLGVAGTARFAHGLSDEQLEAFWRARYLWSLREHGAIREALRLLNALVAEAPGYAPAHAALADIYAHKTAEELDIERQDTFVIAGEHLSQALRLDPDLADAIITRAYLSFFRDRNIGNAISQIDQAIAVRPDSALAWQTKAMILSAGRQGGASIDAIDRARAFDPLSASILWDRVWFLYVAGRYDQAQAAVADARRVSPPVLLYEALVALAQDDHDSAFEAMLSRARARNVPAAGLERLKAIAAADGAGAALAQMALRVNSEDAATEHPVPRSLILLALNLPEEAIGLLSEGGERDQGWWWNWYDALPQFDAIRRDARLSSLDGAAQAIR